MSDDIRTRIWQRLRRDAVRKAWAADPAKGKVLAKMYNLPEPRDPDGPVTPTREHVLALLAAGHPPQCLHDGHDLTFRVERRRGRCFAVFRADNCVPIPAKGEQRG